MTSRAKMRTRCAAAFAASLVLQAPDLRGNQEGSYIAPRSGWLWVVDSDNFGADGKVLLVDPGARRVVSSLRAGFQPDIVLSLDGSRLYLAYSTGDQRRGFLDVIDTANGAILQHLETPTDTWPLVRSTRQEWRCRRMAAGCINTGVATRGTNRSTTSPRSILSATRFCPSGPSYLFVRRAI